MDFCRYELSSPFLSGVHAGWCSNWTQLPGVAASGDAAAAPTWQTLAGFACDIGKSPVFSAKVAGPAGAVADSQCQQLCAKNAGCVEWQLGVSSLACWGYDVHSKPAKNGNFDCGCQGGCSGSPPPPAPPSPPSPPSPRPPPPPHDPGSYWTNLTESECWARCNSDVRCNQAVYEVNGSGQCWTGMNMMLSQPASSRPGCKPGPCVDTCYAKSKHMVNVTIREEKFIAANDVVSTVITSSRPVTLEVSGRTFADADSAAGKVLTLNGQCFVDKATNSIHTIEGGTVAAHVQNNADQTPVYATGKLMYDGMSSVISTSRPMVNGSTYTVDPQTVGGMGRVCGYTFYVPVNTAGTTISWAMNDDHEKALSAVKQVLADPARCVCCCTVVVL